MKSNLIPITRIIGEIYKPSEVSFEDKDVRIIVDNISCGRVQYTNLITNEHGEIPIDDFGWYYAKIESEKWGMTREEALKILKYNSNVIHKTIDGETDPKEVKALDMAIKALEQEPVLDKIRAEIELHRRKTESIDSYDLVGDCLDIIDKYKRENGK